MFEDEAKNSKALHEVIELVVGNCVMQTRGFDVGIPFIAGAPGGGKTASIHHLSKQYNFSILSTHLALKPIEETGGIPQFEKIMINGQELIGTIWSFPDLMKSLYTLSEEKNENEIVIWLLDDSHLLSPIHMAMLYELFTERSLRGYKIPNNCAIIMAGNTSNKSGAKTMFSAIVNRCVFMPVHTDFDSWKNNYALRSDVNVHPAFISFLKNVKYQKFFHEDEQVDAPWGSPRSWTRLATEVKIREAWSNNKVLNSDILLYIGSGYVGKEGASEFVTYYKIFSEFNLNEIYTDYLNFDLPTEDVKKYALAYALTTDYIGRNDREKVLPAISHLVCLFMQEAPELSIMIVKEMRQLEKSLNKRDILNKIMLTIQKSEPDLVRRVLKDVIDLN